MICALVAAAMIRASHGSALFLRGPRFAASSATVPFHTDLDATRRRAADLIRIINGVAESLSNPDAVYARA